MRKALKIEPGFKVLFRLEDDKLILKKLAFDAVAVFERIAKSGKSVSKIDPYAAYDEEEERYKRTLSRRQHLYLHNHKHPRNLRYLRTQSA